MATAKKRRSGPSGYKPEHEANRQTERIQVRVEPEVARAFEALAEEDGTTKADTFAALVTKERARRNRR